MSGWLLVLFAAVHLVLGVALFCALAWLLLGSDGESPGEDENGGGGGGSPRRWPPPSPSRRPARRLNGPQRLPAERRAPRERPARTLR